MQNKTNRISRIENIKEESGKEDEEELTQASKIIMNTLETSGLRNCGVNSSGALVGFDKLGQRYDIKKVDGDEQYMLLHSIRSNYLVLPAQLIAVNTFPPIYLQTTPSHQYDLETLLDQQKFLPHQLIYKISLDLVRGLIDLHQHEIAHFDVKPQNIVLGNDLKWKYTNFNVAQQLPWQSSSSSSTPPNQPKPARLLKGLTVYYSSPEQYLEFYGKNMSLIQQQYQPTGLASDVYSLGLVFLRLGGKEISSGDAEKSKQRPYGFSKIVSQKLLDYNRITLSMLAYNPQERPSLNQIHQELSDLLEKSQNTHLYDLNLALQQQQQAKSILSHTHHNGIVNSYKNSSNSNHNSHNNSIISQHHFKSSSLCNTSKNGSSSCGNLLDLSHGQPSARYEGQLLSDVKLKQKQGNTRGIGSIGVVNSANSSLFESRRVSSGMLCSQQGATTSNLSKESSCCNTPVEIHEQSTSDESKIDPKRVINVATDTQDRGSSSNLNKVQSSTSLNPSESFGGKIKSLTQRTYQPLKQSTFNCSTYKSKRLVLKKPFWIASPKASALPPISSKQYFPSTILPFLSPRQLVSSNN